MLSTKNKEEIAEDYCFVCKDGGNLRVCDFKNCLKAYHPQCVGKEEEFLESDENFVCGWHTCFICKRTAYFQCYCCPSFSVCRACIKEAEFVQVKRRTKGLCRNCLRLATLIEQNVDIESEGATIDFRDSETYEFLFKDYWEIVKEKEGLSLIDIQTANACLRSGKNFKELPEFGTQEETSEEEYIDDKSDAETDIFYGLNAKGGRPSKAQKKRGRSTKRRFVSWGSSELIEFLSSTGKDVSKPLTQQDVCEIIKGYVHANNLFVPGKKKKQVMCDGKLHALFRKKKMRAAKIYSLLESHFPDSDDEIVLSSDGDDGEDDEYTRKKKPRISLGPKLPKSTSEANKKWLAAALASNIKLLYLKKSLVLEFLKNSENFERKVISCFVRVKNDPKDAFYSPRKPYQLGQVKGIKKIPETYSVGNFSADFILCVSNVLKDVKISMLSEDDFEEEECEYLRELVKKGLFKMPTVGEFEEKLGIVHKDIVNHGIDKELARLDKLIDFANEKGWRREMFEHMDRRELLHKPAERLRLLEEVPEVVPELEGQMVLNASADDSLKKSIESSADIAGCESAALKSTETGNENEGCKQHNLPESNLSSEISGGNNSKTSPKPDLGREAKIVIDLEDDEGDGEAKIVIDLEDDEGDGNADGKMLKVWHYLDPEGNEHGPFSMLFFLQWKLNGYLDDNFKVWKTGQPRDRAVPLADALRMTL